MLRSYYDIVGTIGRPPLWYDTNGVPRYLEFEPDMCGVYDKYVAKLEIACQYCGQVVTVSSEVDGVTAGEEFFKLPAKEEDSPWTQIGSFHYGDPPPHGCVGDSMNSVPRKILEFWKRVLFTERAKEGTTDAWKRLPEYEFELVKYDDKD